MVEVLNLEEFQAELERLRTALNDFPETAMSHLERTVRQALELLATYAAEYPRKPPDSRYRRTGTLGRLWIAATPHITTSGHVLDARIRNATPYGPLVQDPGEQLEVHRGRWQTTEQVVSEHAAEIAPLLAQAGMEIVDRIAEAV